MRKIPKISEKKINVSLAVRTMLGYTMRTETENYFKAKLPLNDTGLSEALYRVGWLAGRDVMLQQLPPETNRIETSNDAERQPSHG